MKMNSRMRSLLAMQGGSAELLASSARLPEELRAIIAAGWVIGPGGSLLLAALWGDGWSKDHVPVQAADYEYEVNDVAIPAADLGGDPDRYLGRAAARGIQFAARAMRAAAGLAGAESLIAVVGTGVDQDFLTHGTTVKFFTQRGDYPRWFDDLERFTTEAIAVLNMSDAASSPLRS
jgi:hypothetical protein